jgi:type VI secretion system protein ImpM
MLERFLPVPLITAPAIWGRLPAHADFVRSGMRHAEVEGWCAWLAAQGRVVDRGGPTVGAAALPAAFVLPPGTLDFARRQFVVGVVAPSVDSVGRRHVLLVYQLARASWVHAHFQAQARHPRDWLFWLARTVARHAAMAEVADVWTLARAVESMWRLHAPAGHDLRWLGRAPVTRPVPAQHAGALLERLLGLSSMNDPAARVMGVRHLPWVDWPECLRTTDPDAGSTRFWQQDAGGGFVNAGRQLGLLWGSER